ncbi:unnamed protein product [Euphydryas editha]|uniref:Uncharacterized protein n=1 Tax=Euphydryas editha TaxID=104508 RepID=A0AAU9UMX4_EUPED|nr:unnamed protein product [Euphydryas editha]
MTHQVVVVHVTCVEEEEQAQYLAGCPPRVLMRPLEILEHSLKMAIHNRDDAVIEDVLALLSGGRGRD